MVIIIVCICCLYLLQASYRCSSKTSLQIANRDWYNQLDKIKPRTLVTRAMTRAKDDLIWSMAGVSTKRFDIKYIMETAEFKRNNQLS